MNSDKLVSVNELADLLRLSELIDIDFYRAAAGIDDYEDPYSHYVDRGWRLGLQPNSQFEGEFLKPFYEAAGICDQPPAYSWLEFSAYADPLPANLREAEALASRLRVSPVFDAAFYAERLPNGLDPALHYVIIGERLGWRPSALFDPVYYLERHPDIAAAGIPPWKHFEDNGRSEGRRIIAISERLTFPPIKDVDKPVVLLITHEASRTGAPVLGWNIARLLAERVNIVLLMMRGGELEADFVNVAASAIGPLRWEDWHHADTIRLAKRITLEYRPLYAIANSIETHIMVPALAALGVPSIALVHEFAAYTRPVARMRDVFDWASHVVFPANIVAESSYDAFPGLRQRPGIHIMAQGAIDAPRPITGQSEADQGSDVLTAQIRPRGYEDAFIVLGVGTVEIRKGVDLFLIVAASVRRLRPDLRFRFVWIGHGYDPTHDTTYSAYLGYQIAQSNLSDGVVMLDPVANLDPAYELADAVFLSSRLDPQPNVGIDAIVRGIPTVCFDRACGTAEILKADSATQHLVAPHLDVHQAAAILCSLAEDRERTVALRAEVARVGSSAYDMDAYIEYIEALGKAAAASLHDDDLATLANSAAVDMDMALPPNTETHDLLAAERQVLQQWSIMGLTPSPTVNPHFRRPCAGFNPQVYAKANSNECGPGQAHPLAHWLRSGQPKGPWSRDVFGPSSATRLLPIEAGLRVALHAHFYYERLADEFAARLTRNQTCCDLFVSTDTDEKAKYLRSVFSRYPGPVNITVLPNRGRDIGPFFTGLSDRLAGGTYDVIGHIHGHQSLDTDSAMGEARRDFLWENLIGGEFAMIDLVVSVFEANPRIGLLMAEDPHLVGWDANRTVAEDLARKMKMSTPLADFFDFPFGRMFWCRPDALRPIFELAINWNEYPPEPLPYNGTILHAIERLLPFAVEKAGFTTAGLRVPGTNW
jgi:glycosyltransferase involved in cell wall biosynthesis